MRVHAYWVEYVEFEGASFEEFPRLSGRGPSKTVKNTESDSQQLCVPPWPLNYGARSKLWRAREREITPSLLRLIGQAGRKLSLVEEPLIVDRHCSPPSRRSILISLDSVCCSVDFAVLIA